MTLKVSFLHIGRSETAGFLRGSMILLGYSAWMWLLGPAKVNGHAGFRIADVGHDKRAPDADEGSMAQDPREPGLA